MKIGFEKLFDVFFSFFFAPAIHFLSPNSPVFRKGMKLQKLIAFFLQVAHSYHLFKSKLQNAIQNKKLSTNQSNILLNLKDVFEFFLPAVCSFMSFVFTIF
jgi:hypothetical protein